MGDIIYFFFDSVKMSSSTHFGRTPDLQSRLMIVSISVPLCALQKKRPSSQKIVTIKPESNVVGWGTGDVHCDTTLRQKLLRQIAHKNGCRYTAKQIEASQELVQFVGTPVILRSDELKSTK